MSVYFVICSILLVFYPPTRRESKNLQGASNPVRTPKSDHHCPSDCHLGMHCHRKSKAHCFLEQARCLCSIPVDCQIKLLTDTVKVLLTTSVSVSVRRTLHRSGGHPGSWDGEPDDLRCFPAALGGVCVCCQSARHQNETYRTWTPRGTR